MIYLDTETCGFTGPVIIIQYAKDNEPIRIHHVWHEEVNATINLIEWMLDDTICGFNLTFDWFHIQRIYWLMVAERDWSIKPSIECAHIHDTPNLTHCLKPRSALDLFLHARRTEFQSTMDRKPIRIKNVPNEVVDTLATQLSNRLRIPDIYFSYRSPNWERLDEGKKGFSDLRLNFGASGALKAIIRHLKLDETPDADAAKEINTRYRVKEYAYKPYGNDWHIIIQHHIDYWRYNARAIKYAEKDVEYLRLLRTHFNNPSGGDTDSLLAICIACVRYRGLGVDIDRAEKTKNTYTTIRESAPRSPSRAKAFLEDASPVPIPDTSKKTLEGLAALDIGIGERAKAILGARQADKIVDLCNKVIHAERFHPDFKIIGARSGRMSGGGDGKLKSINPQGIQRNKPNLPEREQIRAIFRLRDEGLPILCGGDFAAFEVTIQAAVWADSKLTQDLKTGERIYDIFGRHIGDPDVDYHKRKTGFLGWSYGAHDEKIASVLGVDIGVARRGLDNLLLEYPGIEKARHAIAKRFQPMQQPGGLGTAVIWHEPDDYIETLFGFRRYFTLENEICHELYDLATNTPPQLLSFTSMVQRTESRGPQQASGAMRSALYAAAFNIQSSNVRQANNHVIQGTGAWVNKVLQKYIWDLQPHGITPWRVAPINIHDEVIVAVVTQEIADKTKEIAKEVEEEFREKIPLIKLDWSTEMDTWASKT